MAEGVTALVAKSPTTVVVSADVSPRFSANELRMLKAQTGRTMDELFGAQADDADRWQTMAWLQLRRDGHSVTWDECGDIEVEMREESPDPTNGARSTSSPDSAVSGT